LDDVVIQFNAALARGLEELTGDKIDIEQITTWGQTPFRDAAKSAGYASHWDWLKDHAYVWVEAELMPGADEGLARLRKLGFKVELLTSKPSWARWIVFHQIARHGLDVDRVTIVPTSLAQGAHKKVRKVDWSSAYYLVDDGPHNLEEWALAGRAGIVFDRPWNRGDVDTWRAYSWPEVVQFFALMSRVG